MNKVSRLRSATHVLQFAALIVPLATLSAETNTVWQIGKFDQSPVEFLSEAKGSIRFEVGKNDWKSDWPKNAGVGDPYQIIFDLHPTSGVYLLKVSLLIERPRIPMIQIEVNGHSGNFYLHPQLSYSRSDFTFAFDPHEAQSELDIELPNSFLKEGRNVISLAAVDNPTSTADEQKESGLTFDALALEQDTARQFSTAVVHADVRPTIFFRSGEQGLLEDVEAVIRFNQPVSNELAELEVNGRNYLQKTMSAEFGEQQLIFQVPEWSGSVNATLKVRAGTTKSFPISLAAQRKWNIFLVPHTHLDVGFTDFQGKVAEIQSRVLTQAAALIEKYPDFRFSMDGSWNLEQLLNTRSSSMQNKILDLIRNRKMAMPVQYVNLLTGYSSLETMYRSLYASRHLSTKYKLPFEYANITDVPTYSGSYPSVLAASGVKYWVAAANNDRAPIFNYEQWNEKSPFWWEGPDGKKVLFWYSRHYEQSQTLFGLPPQLPAVRQSLPIYLQAYSKPSYRPDAALIYGTQVENTDLFPSTATFATEWNKTYAFPNLKYSTFPDFFHFLEDHYANDLPTYKGDGGGYWEDGIGSDAYFAAEDRRNQSRVLSAEVLSTLTHTIDSNLNPPSGVFADIWRNIILFAEHTWLSYNSVSQPDQEQSIRQARVKDDRAERAALQIEDVMNRSLSQLADNIQVPADTLVVFNSLNWRRNGTVETDLPANSQLTDLTTKKNVPLQVLFTKQDFQHVRFLAEDLPSIGYKCFSVAVAPARVPVAPTTSSVAIENRFYKVLLDTATGSIAGIYDKQLGRELVDSSSPYKFGEYVYVTGGDGNTQMINPFPALAPGEVTVHHATGGKVLGVERLAWGHSIRLSSSNTNTPAIQTEILLFDAEKKIELIYHIHKTYTNDKEGVYISFPVALATPAFTFATQQGWVDPAHDLMKGGSLEWFNIQGWMAARDQNVTLAVVPVDTSLASFGDINRGKWPGTFEPKSGTMFSYVMNNYWHTNYRAGQGGDFIFRYAITSANKLDGAALSRLSAEEMRPAELDHVVSQDKAGNPNRPLPKEGRQFLELKVPNIILNTWKRAEDGKGLIMRLQETDGKATQATARFPYTPVTSAQLCSGVEESGVDLPVKDNSLQLSFRPFEVLSVRILD